MRKKYVESLCDEYYAVVAVTCGHKYANYVTWQKHQWASLWWNELPDFRKVDDLWNRKYLRSIFFGNSKPNAVD